MRLSERWWLVVQNKETKLIFEMSRTGCQAGYLPACDVPTQAVESLIPASMLRKAPARLPEVSEIDLVRHFTNLSQKNHGVDAGFYPLGSCTMKYNPKINEAVAALSGFTALHPDQPDATNQGTLQILHELSGYLAEITGMDAVTLQPAAGAHGELTGMMMVHAYHKNRGDDKRTKILIPDAAHGTNPASAILAGFSVVQIKTAADGGVDMDSLRSAVGEDTAGLMLTNPSTLGLFDANIEEIAKIVHDAGGLLYYDGANANAIMGLARPGDMGFDVVHLNIHKTFSTPHGGGGPGSGPVGVKKDLIPFLPTPVVCKTETGYKLDSNLPLSIGKVKGYYGNIGVLVRAYAYIRALGGVGLRQASENAVLNANYIRAALDGAFEMAYNRICMHEFVISGQKQKRESQVSTLDMAKRLLDFGFHPPTVYFPLIVKEALMIEPTETESKQTLDSFIAAMLQIADEAKNQPEMVTSAPHTTIIGRLDEVKAVKEPMLRYTFE